MRRDKKKAGHRLLLCLAVIVILLQIFAPVAFGQAGEPDDYIFATIDIPLPDGRIGFTSLEDINDEGQIAGAFTNRNLGPYGFLLNFNNKKKCTVIDFPGANLTETVGVNDGGQVVGDYRDANTGIWHGFLWDAGQFWIIDVPFPGARSTSPTGINNVGQIVGFYFDDNVSESFPNGHTHGFFYDNGRFTSFDFPDAVATEPIDLNDDGQIVGVFAAEGDSIARSFLLHYGTFTTVDVPFPGVLFTQVRGINNQGQVVGRYVVSNQDPNDVANPFLSHGFVASPNVNLPLVASLTYGQSPSGRCLLSAM